MKSIVRNIKHVFTLLVILSQIEITTAQNIGGTNSKQSSPKEVKAAELSKGAYTSDVNLFTGTMATSYDLGTVSTFSGLSYKLQLNYSSTRSLGNSPIVVAGIPYGDGWSLNLPTISITTESFQKYTNGMIGGQYSPYQPTLSYSKDEATKEGAIHWFAPFINIPGVVSDRFILKTIDTLKNESIFVCNNMDHYIEARLRFNSIWSVTNYNGDVYEFMSAVGDYKTAPQLNYVVDSLRYTSGVTKRNLLPKEEPSLTWYCNTIYNKNSPQNQMITFHYKGFGLFDFYKEFNQPTLNQSLGSKVGFALASFPKFLVQRDILLESISSQSDRGAIENLELNYKTLNPIFSPNMLVLTEKSVKRLDSLYNYRIVYSQGVDNATDSSFLHSNAYNPIAAGLSFNYGLNQVQPNFNSWRRYLHVMSSDYNIASKRSYVGLGSVMHNNVYFNNNHNPYLINDFGFGGGQPSYVYRNVPSATSEVPFDHGFLESPRIVNDIVPGDIYEVRSIIKDLNSSTISTSGRKLCLFDINVVSGSQVFTSSGASFCGTGECGDPVSSTVHLNDYVEGSRGYNVFSTFNNPVKWNSLANGIGGSSTTGMVVTSNFFLMPFVPERFNGINVQIGPANSDHDFSLEQVSITNHLGYSAPSTYLPSSYHAYKKLQQGTTYGNDYSPEKLDSPHTKPSNNFGIGMPWYMMNEVYSDLVGDGLHNQTSTKYRFWWRDPISPASLGGISYPNEPTAADANVKLAAFEVVRYSKNPYMLSSVKKYKCNGYDYEDSIIKNKYVVNQLNINYNFRYDTVYTNIYEKQNIHFTKDTVVDCLTYLYTAGAANLYSRNVLKNKEIFGIQNTYLIKEIKQIPVNGAQANAPTTYVLNDLPTTHFSYTKLKTDSMSGFNSRYDFTGNLFVLSSIVDQLGGKMTYDYYPLHDTKHTHYVNSYVDNNYSGVIPVNMYNIPLSDVYKVQIAVRTKKYFNSTGAILASKIWAYDYLDLGTACNNGAPKTAKGNTISTGTHYLHNSNSVDFGFKTTIVKYPKLVASAAPVPYDVYTHYSTENRGLTFGKLKTVEKFDASATILNKKEYIYKSTMAYGNFVFTNNEVISDYTNEDNIEIWGLFDNSLMSPLTNIVKSNYSTYPNLNTSDIDDLSFLEITNSQLFNPTGTYLNCYFTRLVKEISTDYDLSTTGSDLVVSNPGFSGVTDLLPSGSLTDRLLNPLLAGRPIAQPISGINSFKLNLHSLLATNPGYPIGPMHPALFQTTLSNITEYEYWDSDSVGKTTSNGFRYLLNNDSNMSNTIRLVFEPSWELFRTKSYSPHLIGAYSSTENYYYYDLKQDVNKWNANPLYEHMNQFDALLYSHKYGIRNLGYQKRVISKAVNQPEVIKSEYYWYDSKTKSDVNFIYDTLYFSGMFDSCPTPWSPTDTITTPPFPTGCISIPHPYSPPPVGFHLTEVNPGDFMYCPDAYSPPTGTSGTVVLRTGASNLRQLILPNDLGTKLLLRQSAQQVDTVYKPESDPTGSHYHQLVRFKEFYNPGFAIPYSYKWALPFETKLNYQTLEHTPMGFVRKDLNERGLQTTYYYHHIYSTSFIDSLLVCNNGYGAFDLTNQGVPQCITVGSNQNDSLQTCYRYNKDFTIDTIIDPNKTTLSYKYDNFSRMRMASRNTDTLSFNAYSQWINDTTLSFEQRADQNFVESYILLNKGSQVAEHSRAYIDPLGRKYDVQTQITSNYTNPLILDTLMVHSGLTTYDNWDRVSQQFKPFKYTNTGAPVNFAPRFNPLGLYTEQQYEPNQRGRVLRSAKFGESISTGHTVNSSYQFITGMQLKAELSGLTIASFTEIAGTYVPTALYAQRYLKTANIDEDSKKTVSYTNALGQKIATKTYANGITHELTAYVYDSQGNLKKVFNPRMQITTYEFNLCGNMYRKVSADADTVKYMYDESGNVVLEEDANARKGKYEPTNQPYMRRYIYDPFGRLVLQERVTDPQHNTLKYASAPFPSSIGSGVQYYKYSYASTLYFLGGWKQFSCSGFSACTETFIYPDVNIYSLAKEKQFVFNYPANYPSTPYLIYLGAATSAYLIANPPNSANGQNHIKGRLSLGLSFDNNGVFSNLVAYSYNAAGLPERELVQFNASGSTIINSIITYPNYNLRNSLLTQMVDVNADNITDMEYHYDYDGWNRLRNLSVKQGALGAIKKLASYDYNDALGLITKTKHYNVNNATCNNPIDSIEYSYDDRNRLMQLNSRLYKENLYYNGNAPLTSNPAFDVVNSYNYNGNINGIKHLYKLQSTTNYVAIGGMMDSSTVYGYTYDGINRLAKADASVLNVLNTSMGTALLAQKLNYGDETINYDAIGNINNLTRGLYYNSTITVAGSQQQNWNYNYQLNKNQLTHIDSVSTTPLRNYEYDANGNQTKQTIGSKIITTSYMRGNLANTQTVGKAINYSYNTTDDRVFTYNLLGTKTYYLRDAMGKELAELDVLANTWTHYAYGRERIAEFKTSGTNYYINDHLGSTRLLYNTNSECNRDLLTFTVESANDYYAFGKTLRSFNNSKYGFTGKENDRETNLLNFGARRYDSEICRWNLVDPLADKYISMSPYNYAVNNPVFFKDPDGEDIVYFNSQGQETSRTADKNVNQTFVQVQVPYNPPTYMADNTPMPMRIAYTYVEATMPGKFEGFSDDKYQKYDYQIAASTFVFNQNKNNDQVPAYTNGSKLSDPSAMVPDINPNFVKAIIMEETKMGTCDPNTGDSNDSKKDVMQANVYYSSSSNDWNDSKKQFGLTENGGVSSPAQSINAGIGILYQKGLKGGNGTKWTGGSNWTNAAKNYNGGGNADYVKDIMNLINSIIQ